MNILKPQNGWVVLTIVIGWQILGALFFTLGPYPAINALKVGTMPEERFGNDGQVELSRWMEDLEASGRELYQRFQLLDVINALITAIALTIGLAFNLSRLFPSDHFLYFLTKIPASVFILELFENLLLYLNSARFPDQIGASLLPLITMTKLVLGFGSILIFMVTAIWLLIRYFRNRNKKEI